MKIPFFNLVIRRASSITELTQSLASQAARLVDLIASNRSKDDELARLQEALWFAQSGGYAKADGGNLAIPEIAVREYEEYRRWTANERLDLTASIKLIGLTQDELHLISMARTVEFRGLKWMTKGISRDRPTGPFEPPVVVDLFAFAHSSESVPNFKRSA